MSKKVFKTKSALTILWYLLPAAIFVAVFTYYPMFQGGIMAFQDYNLNNINETPWVGFENFKDVTNDPDFNTILLNSFVWTFCSLIPQLFIGMALALWLKKKFRFQGVYQALVFFPWAISGFLIGLIFRWMFNDDFGVVNDLLLRTGIIEEKIMWLSDSKLAMVSTIIANIWYGVTFFTIMILAALQGVPDDLYEAASLDGAGKIRQFWHITLPSIRLTLALTILLRVIWIMNFPDIIWSMTNGGPANQTHILSSWMITLINQGAYGQASALGIMLILILMIFAVFYMLVMRGKKVTK